MFELGCMWILDTSKIKIKESSKTNENFNVLNLVVHCFLFNFWKKKDLVVLCFWLFYTVWIVQYSPNKIKKISP